MKIRMRTLAAGPLGTFLDGHAYSTPTDLSEEQAHAFVEAGAAEVVAAETVIEVEAVQADEVEQAVAPRPRGRSARKAKDADAESEE